MGELIALSCLNCGGKLQIKGNIKEFTCPYCETAHLYNPKAGMVSLANIEKCLNNIENGIENVEKGVDKTAAELALRRLKEELASMPYGGNADKIKHEIWDNEYLQKNLIQTLLIYYNKKFKYIHDVDLKLRKKADHTKLFTQRSIMLSYEIFGISENEIRDKWFGDISYEQLIDIKKYLRFMSDLNKKDLTVYSNNLNIIIKKIDRMIRIFEINNLIRENESIVNF